MPKPLSADIRDRFRMLFESGLSGREAARRVLISAATASWVSHRPTSSPSSTARTAWRRTTPVTVAGGEGGSAVGAGFGSSVEAGVVGG
jgi:hypothetical protein